MADRHCIESCQGNCIASAFGLREMKTVILLTLVALLPAACSRHKGGPGASQSTTQTIAPASAPAGPDTSGTDAMTQTVLVDDSRSESESMASASTTTAAKKPPVKAPAKKKGKK
jgi:hypothetical protein